MEEFKFNGYGPDVTYLANTNIFFATVYTLDVFHNNWRDELGTQSVLEKAHGWYRQSFEGGLTGNRTEIAARKEARKALDVIIQKILYYVAIFANESDIKVLLSTGVVTKKSKVRARRTVKPAPAA